MGERKGLLRKNRKPKYYSLDRVLRHNAIYNVIIGERSNGKTYSVLKYAINEYFNGNGGELAIIRRWQEDIRGMRAKGIFSALIENGEVKKLSKGEYDGIHYYGGKFYFCNYDEQGKPIYNTETDLFAHAFALSATEHNKSISFPRVKTILFDEFITRGTYLPDEFVLFMNTVSTIVRQRSNVKIFMLGNTVNKYCPYFAEMGLTHIQKMKQGSIDIYTYGSSPLTVAVEYCSSLNTSKDSDVYFAFDNPKLKMITEGSWELDIYPHCPVKFTPKDIVFIYFIIFDGQIYQCEIVEKDGEMFTYIHVKTTPLQDEDNDIIYSLEHSHKMNWNRSIYKPTNEIMRKILYFFQVDKVFYQNNEVGDAINNYLNIAKKL